MAFMLGYFLPLSVEYVRFFYTISQFLKDLLLFVLPFFIIGCLSFSISRFDKQAPFFVIVLIGGIFLSIFTALWFAYGVGSLTLPFLGLAPLHFHNTQEALSPYWRLPFGPFFTTDKAMLIGLMVGIFSRWIPLLISSSVWLRTKTGILFKHFFIPLLPFYILGFVAKLKFEGLIQILFKVYGNVFVITIASIVLYLIIFYVVSFGMRGSYKALKVMLPAGVTGFCTSSSAVTMPLTIEATSQNIKDPLFAEFIIPSTVNLHMIADSINNVLSSFALLLIMGNALPAPYFFLKFSVIYLLTSLSFSGVPGGIVFVLVPVLEKHLGLSSDASALYITIMALMDPFVTSGNVMGNGALAQLMRRITKRMTSQK